MYFEMPGHGLSGRPLRLLEKDFGVSMVRHLFQWFSLLCPGMLECFQNYIKMFPRQMEVTNLCMVFQFRVLVDFEAGSPGLCLPSPQHLLWWMKCMTAQTCSMQQQPKLMACHVTMESTSLHHVFCNQSSSVNIINTNYIYLTILSFVFNVPCPTFPTDLSFLKSGQNFTLLQSFIKKISHIFS